MIFAKQFISKFNRFLGGTALLFVTIIVLFSMVPFLQGRVSESNFTVFVGLFSLIFILNGLVLIIAFLAGLPMMGMHWWFTHRLHKLGFDQFTIAPSSMKTSTLQVIGAIGTIFGIFIIMGFFAYLVGSIVEPQYFESASNDSDAKLGSVVGLVIGLLLTVPHFIHRRQQSHKLLSHIDTLKTKLCEYISLPSDTDTVEIPVEDLNLLASLEQSQIALDRAHAINAAKKETHANDYVLLNSRNTAKAMSTLKPEARLQVQSQAVELTHIQQPRNAIWDESEGLWHLKVPDAQVQLNYIVDKDKHQIRVLSLDKLQQETGVTGSGQ